MTAAYRVALRPHDGGDPDLMDDVVIHDVSMFRAEQMDNNSWWVCCWLAGVDEQVHFSFTYNRQTRNLEMRHDGHRIRGVVYEDDPPTVDSDQLEMF